MVVRMSTKTKNHDIDNIDIDNIVGYDSKRETVKHLYIIYILYISKILSHNKMHIVFYCNIPPINANQRGQNLDVKCASDVNG